MELEKITNILGAETVKKIYEDAAAPAVQEAGKMAADVVNTLRLFTAPIQLAASYQDRLTRHFENVRSPYKIDEYLLQVDETSLLLV